nr:hypothetical protein GCM10020093_024580 [Planobispora longispora]
MLRGDQARREGDVELAGVVPVAVDHEQCDLPGGLLVGGGGPDGGVSPYLAVGIVAHSGSTRSTSPRACRAVSAKGWKIVCRQAGPPGSVLIGAITLASWAWQATPTRSALRSSVMSRLPTTTASVTS